MGGGVLGYDQVVYGGGVEGLLLDTLVGCLHGCTGSTHGLNPGVDPACFQRLKLTYDESPLNLACKPCLKALLANLACKPCFQTLLSSYQCQCQRVAPPLHAGAEHVCGVRVAPAAARGRALPRRLPHGASLPPYLPLSLPLSVSLSRACRGCTRPLTLSSPTSWCEDKRRVHSGVMRPQPPPPLTPTPLKNP